MVAAWQWVKGGVRPGQRELKAARELTAEWLSAADNLITGDALYCQREYCRQIRDAWGDYPVIVKKNRPELYDAIALAFTSPVEGEQYRRTQSRNWHGGGRERRRLWATEALNEYLEEHLGWPGVGQVCRIECRVEQQGHVAAEVRYAITGLGREVSASRLLGYLRGHWEIENRLHYVRDVALGEDAGRMRTGPAPQVMALLRNVMLSLLRWGGFANIAAALRQLGWLPGQAMRLIGLLDCRK